MRWKRLIKLAARRFVKRQEAQFSDIVADYDVVIMKHCFPSSDILEDTGNSDPSSPRQSMENYKAIYRLLKNKFNENPDTLFIVWTLPPRHRLFEPSEGDKDANAARATAFSNWLKGDFLTGGGSSHNIYIWDFREFVMDSGTNFLRYEYELSHSASDSHPDKLANNEVGPRLAQFIVDSIADFAGSRPLGQGARIVFLCHSTGQGVYEYSNPGVHTWFNKYNAANGTDHSIYDYWYPLDGNMPVDYYCCWLTGQ